MAKFWALQIIRGRRKFSQVPHALKDAVRQCLIEEGREDRITE